MTDLALMVVSALWTVAVGLTSYAAGVRRGLALADSAGLAEDDGGWDWETGAEGEESA